MTVKKRVDFFIMTIIFLLSTLKKAIIIKNIYASAIKKQIKFYVE